MPAAPGFLNVRPIPVVQSVLIGNAAHRAATVPTIENARHRENVRREALEKPYDPEPLIRRLRELLEKHNESYREGSLRAGLDHQGVRRVLDGQRPSMHICILLADHYGINPNEFLTLAG